MLWNLREIALLSRLVRQRPICQAIMDMRVGGLPFNNNSFSVSINGVTPVVSHKRKAKPDDPTCRPATQRSDLRPDWLG